MTFSEPSRPRRRGRGIVAVGLSVLILAGAALAADRVLLSSTQSRIEAELVKATGATSPEVKIGGFPFLTQIVGGSLHHLTVTADAVTYDSVTLTDVTVVGEGVPLDLSAVDSVELTGTLPTASIQTLVSSEIEKATGQDLTITVAVSGDHLVASTLVLGLVPLEMDLRPHAAGRGVQVEIATIRLSGLAVAPGDLPFDWGKNLSTFTVDISQLPQGLELTSAQVLPDGVELVAAGSNVELPIG